MLMDNENNADDRIVVGYFANGRNAARAIDELLDEGFVAPEIGAAFRTPVTGMEVSEGGRARGVFAENPALSGSVGGPASHDQAVTPAGLAPGSGNAFPAPEKTAPIPGSQIPSTLPHELPHELPSTLHSESTWPVIRTSASPAPAATEQEDGGRRWESDSARRERLREVFADSSETQRGRRDSAMKFGTGEGHLFPDLEYSEPAFEYSFLGMGLNAREARILSNELNSGGAVVSIAPGSRASLAEAILERNHGSVRFEKVSTLGEACEGNRVEIYGRMRNYYRPDESVRRKAS